MPADFAYDYAIVRLTPRVERGETTRVWFDLTTSVSDAARPGESHVLEKREKQDQQTRDKKKRIRGEPDKNDRQDDEDGAAQDPGHFALSATGDGLIPPYRRSRFW